MCDYEEYTGRIEKGNVPITAPAKGRIAPLLSEDGPHWFFGGEAVKEGGTIYEIVPDNVWPALEPKWERLNAVQRQVERTKLSSPRLAKGERDEMVQNALKDRKPALDDLKAAMAKVKTAKVLAPCSGVVQRQQIGEFGLGTQIGSIEPSDAALVSFDVPEGTVLAHRRLPNRQPNWLLSLPVVCALTDDKDFPYRGKVVSVAEDIDPKTHTQRWQAVLPNKNGLFMPGMSVRVRVISREALRGETRRGSSGGDFEVGREDFARIYTLGPAKPLAAFGVQHAGQISVSIIT